MQILDGGVWESNYNDENRGEFQFKNRAKQIISFKGIQYGKITPTDIDALIEFRGKAMILYEVKHNKAKVPPGQWNALKELTDMGERDGKEAACLVCEHNVDNPKDIVYLKDCIVRCVYYRGKITTIKKRITVEEATDKFMKKVGGEKAC